MQPVMIGVDIGTTSTKAVAFTLAGAVVAHHAVGYPLLHPSPGAAEQDPEVIVQAMLTALGAVVTASGVAADGVACVSFSAAMHSLIAVDAQDRPITRSITWADNRSAVWSKRIRTDFDGTALYRRTGTPIHPMSPLAKLLWLRHEATELFARAARFVGIKEFVHHRLCGGWWVDHSIASATGLFNLELRDWDEAALALAGVRREQLSRLVPTSYRLPAIDAGLARSLGLSVDTPFIIGANDGVLSNLGVHATAPGDVAVTIGTSGALRAVIDAPRTDPSGRTFCYVLSDRHWVVGGPVNNGGVMLRWVRDVLATAERDAALARGVDPYDALTAIAQQVVPGSEGLLFHPYLSGERAPHWNADLRGSFFGLATHHRKEHMIRAVLEGVIFNLCSLLPAVEALTGSVGTLKATGGFARSALWRQMLADVFDHEVLVPESFESSCLGAAVLGLHALGLVDSLDVVGAMVGATHRHVPDSGTARLYRELMPIFLALPARLAAEYEAIAAFQLRHAAPLRSGGDPGAPVG